MATPNQITLAFSVATGGTTRTPAQAATTLAAVPLYSAPGTDPVLGQLFGLTVASDVVSTGGLTYSGESGPFFPGDTVTGKSSGATATVAVDEQNGLLLFVEGSQTGTFTDGETIEGSATATVVDNAVGGGSSTPDPGPATAVPGAARVLVLNMQSEYNEPLPAPPPFPCRPTGPVEPPPAGQYAQGLMSYFEDVLSASNPASPNPIVIGVATTEGLADGMVVTVAGVLGNTAANGSFAISGLTDDSFALVGSTGNGAYTGGGTVTIPYELEETTTNPQTRLPQTLPTPAQYVAVYSTSDLDTYVVNTTPPIPAGPGAQTALLVYMDSTGAGPFEIFIKLAGKFPLQATLAGGSVDVAEIIQFYIIEYGGFDNSVGQITLCALSGPQPAIPDDATPADLPGLTDAAQLTITQPLVYLPPSYFALAQQGASNPPLAGDFLVKQDSLTVLTTVSQVGALVAGYVLSFAAQPGAQYTVASVSATQIVLTDAYAGLSPAETAPAAELSYPAQSVSGASDADRTVTAAYALLDESGNPFPLASPPTDEQLEAPLSEFTLPQTTVPAITYATEAGGPFKGGETVKGQKSGGSATVLYDDQGTDNTGLLAFAVGSVKIGFFRGETVTGQASGATATVVNQRTQAPNQLPNNLSGLYARALQLVLGAPVVSQPITLV